MLNLPPFIAYGFLLASAYGIAFFVLFGRGWWQLAAYWFAGVIGFALGQFLGVVLGINILPFGQLNTLEATVLSFIVLFATRALWLVLTKGAPSQR